MCIFLGKTMNRVTKTFISVIAAIIVSVIINIKPSKSHESYCPKGKSCFKFVTCFSKLRHTNGMVFYVLCLSRHKQQFFTASLPCLISNMFK